MSESTEAALHQMTSASEGAYHALAHVVVTLDDVIPVLDVAIEAVLPGAQQ